MIMQEIGVFCGTFNPIHWGHLLMAEFARDQMRLDKVLIIVSPNPPHRHTDLLDGEARFELVSAAVADNPHFEASRIELDREGPSYTVDTLIQLHEQFGKGTRLNFILGEDNIAYLKQWHRSAEILNLARICIAPREWQPTQVGSGGAVDLPDGTQSAILDVPHVPVSSSVIRRRIKEGRTVLYLVPPSVQKIIEEKGYYK